MTKKRKEKISDLSDKILTGIHGIYLFNTVFSFIFSWFEIVKKNRLKEMEENSFKFIYIPVLLNKFLFFTINYYFSSYVENKEGFEIISVSMVISAYLSIGEFLFGFIKDYPHEDNMIFLYIIQLIFSFLGAIFILIIIVYVLCSSCTSPRYFVQTLFCFLTFFCFSGFCYNYDKCDDESEGCECCDCSEIETICCQLSQGKCYWDCCCCDSESIFSCDCCVNDCSDCDCGCILSCFCCCCKLVSYN
jgi:hypothetical protein